MRKTGGTAPRRGHVQPEASTLPITRKRQTASTLLLASLPLRHSCLSVFWSFCWDPNRIRSSVTGLVWTYCSSGRKYSLFVVSPTITTFSLIHAELIQGASGHLPEILSESRCNSISVTTERAPHVDSMEYIIDSCCVSLSFCLLLHASFSFCFL